ncbi:MAG: 3-keto-5-aminohexanoate cleavage protein, partial [Chloroflexota bacterium]
LKACINGSRAEEDHPTLPVTAETIALDAQTVVAAGADAVHFHVRDEDGYESLTPEDVARCIATCREALPVTPLGISTGDWIIPDLDERLEMIRAWNVLPDFVSVNFHEEGAAEVAQMLYERGVGIELGLTFPFSTEIALAGGWGERCMRVLIEPIEQEVKDAMLMVGQIELLLDAAGVSAPRLLHGREETAWPLLIESVKRGYQCRIGLEDTFQLPTSDLAEDNAEIIHAARELIAKTK